MEKKKIALIIDSENWAFHNIAKQLKKNLTNYEIDIIPGRIFNGNMLRLFLFCEDYDLIHFLWRGYLSLINREEMIYHAERNLNIDFEEFKKRYIYSKKITFGVCDHLYLEGNEKWRTEEIFRFSQSYFVTSAKLYDIYSKFQYKPKAIINDGVDLSLYNPTNLDRFKNVNKVTIGWVGNSKFVDSFGNADLKGVYGLIIPAVEELKQEGYNLELKLVDKQVKSISQEEMPAFYNSIDIYVCASKTEGTPLTVLESMAMGIPVISTNVGVVEEVFGEKQKKYILKERSKECLKEAIKEMIRSQDFEVLSKENMEQIKENDWRKISLKYQDFFEENLK